MGHMRNGLKIYLDPKVLTSNAASVQHPESIDSMWVAHIPMQQQAGRQDSSAPAPHSISVVLGGAEPEPTWQRQEALPYVCEWKNGAEGETQRTAKKSAACPNPRDDGKRKNK